MAPPLGTTPRRLLGSAGVTVEACDGARASPLRGRKQLWAVPQRCWQAEDAMNDRRRRNRRLLCSSSSAGRLMQPAE